VYVGAAGSSGGGLFAIRAATGSVAWSQRVYHGDNSSPAVDGNGVYVSYTCGIKHAFAPTTGARLWQTPATCSSSGGRTPVLAAGRLWTRDPSASAGYSVNPADGGVLDRFASTTYRVPAPAFRGRTGLFMDNGRLRASDADTPTVPIWTFTGDGQLSSAPIVVNDHVYVGSGSGQLWALDPITGAPVWSTNVGAPIKEPNELGGNPPTTGLTAGQGRLLVPATNTLSAYGQ
jgi:outer membrane protein assembly factor BamB